VAFSISTPGEIEANIEEVCAIVSASLIESFCYSFHKEKG
jgi:hypothetical protein